MLSLSLSLSYDITGCETFEVKIPHWVGDSCVQLICSLFQQIFPVASTMYAVDVAKKWSKTQFLGRMAAVRPRSQSSITLLFFYATVATAVVVRALSRPFLQTTSAQLARQQASPSGPRKSSSKPVDTGTLLIFGKVGWKANGYRCRLRTFCLVVRSSSGSQIFRGRHIPECLAERHPCLLSRDQVRPC
jgi:hypothetical protein